MPTIDMPKCDSCTNETTTAYCYFVKFIYKGLFRKRLYGIFSCLICGKFMEVELKDE